MPKKSNYNIIPVPVPKGTLTRFGYVTKDTVKKRQTSLRKAVKSYGAPNVIIKLRAIARLRKKTNPKYYKIYTADANWVIKTFIKKKK